MPALADSGTSRKPKCVVLSSRGPLMSGLYRLARVAGRGQTFEVTFPVLLLVHAQVMQVLPGVDAGGMTIVEVQAHRVAADRLDVGDVHLLLAELQDFLARPVTAYLGGPRKHAPITAS